MQNIRAICFDLDNTLWDLAPVIPRAERRLHRWYAQYYPRVTELFSLQRMLEVREAVLRDRPELLHDLSAMRLLALEFMAREAGYPAAMAHEAFDVFQEQRNAVTLYSDVVPVLESMRATHSLFALTNGNADLQAIGIAHLFEQVFTARELGIAKPDLGVYAAVTVASGFAAEEILHVGDDPDNDIVAAAQAGWRTVWLNRNATIWPHADSMPDEMVSDLHQLTKLFRYE
jgi:HAD superfamily hydrolase (TIGR01509 family)